MENAEDAGIPQAGRREFYFLAGLLTFTSVCYLESLSVPFVLDDFRGILWRESIQSLSFADIWRDLPNRVVPLYIYGVTLHAFGPTPGPFHVLSLGLHLAAVLMVYAVIKGAAKPCGKEAAWPALAGSALFALHPLQTQSVVYAWQGLTVMAASLMFFSIWQFLKTDRSVPVLSQRATLLSLSAMLLAGFCKPIAVTVLPMLLICSITVNGERLYPAMRRLWPWFIVTVLIALPVILTQGQEVRDIQAAKLRGTLLDPVSYFMTQQQVIANYLKLTIWPAGQNIDHHIIPVLNGTDWRLWLSAGLHIVLIACGILLRQRLPLASAGILIFYAGHLVESTFLPLEDLMFEHRMYVPMLGVALTAAALLQAGAGVSPAKSRVFVVTASTAAATVLIALTVTTSKRIGIWQSRETLWADAAAKSPEKRRPLVNYGLALVIGKKYAEALEVLLRAKELKGPPDSRLHDALGNAYEGLGENDKAEESLRTALEINPADAFTWKSYGAFLARNQRFTEAVQAFTTAKSIHKNDPVVDSLLNAARADAAKELHGPGQPSDGDY